MSTEEAITSMPAVGIAMVQYFERLLSGGKDLFAC